MPGSSCFDFCYPRHSLQGVLLNYSIVRTPILRDRELSSFRCLADRCQESFLRSQGEHGRASHARERLDRLSPREFLLEPGSPLRHNRRPKPLRDSVPDECRSIVANPGKSSTALRRRSHMRGFFGHAPGLRMTPAGALVEWFAKEEMTVRARRRSGPPFVALSAFYKSSGAHRPVTHIKMG